MKACEKALGWAAPAKLNLMLRIVGRREDGYHLLQTVFQLIDHCDWLRFELRDDEQIRLITPMPDVLEQDNLIVKAACMLQALADKKQGIDISIDKVLPMGGGLGGGSSNAATTLVALNQIWGLNLSIEQLSSLGVGLGADVPVFVAGHSAWAEGVGEVLEPMDLPECWYLVLVPAVHVSTRDVFMDSGLTRNSDSVKIDRFSAQQPYNDCLAVVLKRYPLVKLAYAALARYPVVGLTGTGACVYAAFASEVEARAAEADLTEDWEVFVAKGVDQSPLYV